MKHKTTCFPVLTAGLLTAILLLGGCGDIIQIGHSGDSGSGSTDKTSSSATAGNGTPTSFTTPAAAVAGNLLDSKGNPVDASVLNDKELTAFYFSASWCPPCQQFTPMLISYAEKNKNRLNVVLVSSDRSAALQQQYIDKYKMPFYAVRYGSPAVELLRSTFKLKYIPFLVVVDRNGKVITTEGVSTIHSGKGI